MKHNFSSNLAVPVARSGMPGRERRKLRTDARPLNQPMFAQVFSINPSVAEGGKNGIV
jgi:hypothetical protein